MKAPPYRGGSPTGPESPGGMTKKEAEEFFSMQVLSMMNVAAEIRAGRCQKVLEGIEESLPANLELMTSFEDTPTKMAILDAAIKSYRTSGRPLPPFLQNISARVQQAAFGATSKDCFAFKKCSCFKLWSPEGVDVNKPDPYGWHYIIDTHCGFHWPKIWNYDCGEPVAITLCNGEYPEGTSTGVQPGTTGYAEPHAPMTHGGTRSEFLDGRLVVLDAATRRYHEVDRQGTATGKVFTQGADGHLVEVPGAATTGQPGGKPQGSSAELTTGGQGSRAATLAVLPENALKIGEAARPVDGVWTKVHPGTGEALAIWGGKKWVALTEAQKAQMKNSGHATEQLTESTAGTKGMSPSQSTAGQTGAGAQAAQSDTPSSAALESAIASYESGSAGTAAGRTASTQPVTEAGAGAAQTLLADPSGRRWQYVTDPKTRTLKLTPIETQRGTTSFVWNEKVKAFVAAAAAQ